MNSRTCLYAAHQASGAKLVNFGGWDMPLHYGSQIAEHHTVRRTCGMFDVSHMTVVDVDGGGARDYLRFLLANDVAKITDSGQGLYSAMLNERGGVVDDLIIYALNTGFRLVLNCATREKDLAWMADHAQGFDVLIKEREDLAIIAVQGPEAIAHVGSVMNSTVMNSTAIRSTGVKLTDPELSIGDGLNQLKSFCSIFVTSAQGLEPWQFARTGYTGEDGLEIILPSDEAPSLWAKLQDAGVSPVGLAARDTLRLEAGLNLYGHEMDEDISPLQANMAWTVALEPSTREFLGRNAVLKERDAGTGDKLVGLLMTGRGVLRAEQSVLIDGDRKSVGFYVRSSQF